MQIDPPIRAAPRFPVTSLMALCAIGLSIAWWAGRDMEWALPTLESPYRAPWKLLSSLFLHVGALHLFFNVYWLWVLGTLFERTFGSAKYLALMTVLGLVSGAAEIATSDTGVGLSGVVYGLFAMAFSLRRTKPVFAAAVTVNVIRLFVIWFFVCIALTVTNVMQIGNVAHASGALMGWLIGRAMQGSRRERLASVFGCVAFTAGSFFLAINPQSWLASSEHLAWKATMHAQSEYDRGDYANAAKLYEEIYRAGDTSPHVIYNLGRAYQRLDRNAEALDMYRKALNADPALSESLTPAMASILSNFAHDNAETGDYAAAQAQLAEAADLAPTEPYPWRLKAAIHERLGEHEKAIAAYRKVIELVPADPEAAEAIARLESAETAK